MKFHVGPVEYRLVISDRSVFDSEGNEIEACAIEGRRLILLSRIVEPARRPEVAEHEFLHCWEYHVPKPTNDEERAQLFALVSRQFHADLERQGGAEALMQLPMTRVPHLGKPVPSKLPVASKEPFGRPDRVTCARCDTEWACGSVRHGEPEPHPASGRLRVQRWLDCEVCRTLTVWQEWCDEAGVPTGECVPVPAPRMLEGEAAAKWLAEKAEVDAVA